MEEVVKHINDTNASYRSPNAGDAKNTDLFLDNEHYDYFKESGDDYKILVMPDHPTPLCTQTHSRQAVPYFIYDSTKKLCGVDCFTEETVKGKTFISHGPDVMKKLIEG